MRLKCIQAEKNIAVKKGLACLDLLIALWNIFDGGEFTISIFPQHIFNERIGESNEPRASINKRVAPCIYLESNQIA